VGAIAELKWIIVNVEVIRASLPEPERDFFD